MFKEEAGKVVGLCHKYLEQYIEPGITTKELDLLAKKFIESKGCSCSFEGLYGFPGSICISLNDEVVHGIPGHRVLKNGDIVKSTARFNYAFDLSNDGFGLITKEFK